MRDAREPHRGGDVPDLPGARRSGRPPEPAAELPELERGGGGAVRARPAASQAGRRRQRGHGRRVAPPLRGLSWLKQRPACVARAHSLEVGLQSTDA